MAVDAAKPEHKSPIPPALRKQIEDVDKMYEKPEDQNPPAPTGDEEAGAEQQTPPPAPVSGDDPAAQPAPPPPGSAAAPAGDDWEQKYKVTQGRLDKARQDNQTLTERLASLEQLVATMQANSTSPQPTTEQNFESLITPEEREEYGDQLMDVIARRAREVVAKDIAKLEHENEQLKQRLDGVASVQTTNARQTLYGKLTDAVPNWRELNRDDGFLDWLDETDEFSGRPRRELLGEAFTRQDSGRVIKFFKGYLSVADGPPSNTQPAGNEPSSPPATNGGKPALEDFAAPGRARTAPSAEVTAEKPIFSIAAYTQFMTEKIAGKWKGREKEADAYERDFFQAQKEGRLKP